MFHCTDHGWTSHDFPCPACFQTVTTTGDFPYKVTTFLLGIMLFASCSNDPKKETGVKIFNENVGSNAMTIGFAKGQTYMETWNDSVYFYYQGELVGRYDSAHKMAKAIRVTVDWYAEEVKLLRKERDSLMQYTPGYNGGPGEIHYHYIGEGK